MPKDKELLLPLDYAEAAVDTMMRTYPAEDLPPKGHFHYHQGVFLSGVYQTFKLNKNKEYLLYIKHWLDAVISPEGEIKEALRAELDDMQPGILLFPMIDHFADPRYKKALDSLIEDVAAIPRTKEDGFWHKNHLPDQMWLDGLYMAGPLLAEYGARFDRPDLLDLVTKQAVLMRKNTRDEKSGLWFHAYDESKKADWADPVTGCSSEFWGRSIGWVPVALLNEMDVMPEESKNYQTLKAIVTELLESICRYQSEEGRWYQVVDKADRADNWPENSVSCLFAAALAKAYRLGLAGEGARTRYLRAYEAVIDSLSWEGEDLQVGNVCIGTGVGDYDFYIHRPVQSNDLHGVGAFLLMCSEIACSERCRAASGLNA